MHCRVFSSALGLCLADSRTTSGVVTIKNAQASPTVCPLGGASVPVQNRHVRLGGGLIICNIDFTGSVGSDLLKHIVM